MSEMAAVFWLALTTVAGGNEREVVMKASWDTPVALSHLVLLQYDTFDVIPGNCFLKLH